MSELARARVEERLVKLRLGAVAQRLDAILSYPLHEPRPSGLTQAVAA